MELPQSCGLLECNYKAAGSAGSASAERRVRQTHMCLRSSLESYDVVSCVPLMPSPSLVVIHWQSGERGEYDHSYNLNKVFSSNRYAAVSRESS